MKASRLSLPTALLVMIASNALANPVSTLYLTYTGACAPAYACIAAVQGGSVTSIPTVYSSGSNEIPIAVSSDIRTTGFVPGASGGQYTLGGTATGTSYPYPGIEAYDSTSDGTSNYLVDYKNGGVYRTDRDYQNPTLLFSLAPGYLAITYDRSNNSLWIAGWYASTTVSNYSMSGVLLSSFDTGSSDIGALALDPADQTLWMVLNTASGNLQQHSKSGKHLSTGSFVNYTLGGEFDLGSTVPEPSTLLMSGVAALGMAVRLLRRA